MDPTILLVGLAALLLLSKQQQSGARTSSVIDEEPEKPKDKSDSLLGDVTQLVRELGGLLGQFSSSDSDGTTDSDRTTEGTYIDVEGQGVPHVYYKVKNAVPSLDLFAGQTVDRTSYTYDQWETIIRDGDPQPIGNI